MRLASFHAADGIRPAVVVVGDDVVDLVAADSSLRGGWAELLERGPDCLPRVREIGARAANSVPLGTVRLAPPVRRGSSSRLASTAPITWPSRARRCPST